MIDIYLLCYNEVQILPFVVNHYRKNLPNSKIIIYDNYSTDGSDQVALDLGCEVRKFDTQNSFNDRIHMELKNNIWKEKSDNDWVFVADMDELIEITEDQLKEENDKGITILKTAGKTFVGPREGFNLEMLTYGIDDGGHSKKSCFKRTEIAEINYAPGAHTANPMGNIIYSEKEYRILHYKWISLQHVMDRHKMYSNRMSIENRQKNWAIQYDWTPEFLTEVYESLLPNLIKIL